MSRLTLEQLNDEFNAEFEHLTKSAAYSLLQGLQTDSQDDAVVIPTMCTAIHIVAENHFNLTKTMITDLFDLKLTGTNDVKVFREFLKETLHRFCNRYGLGLYYSEIKFMIKDRMWQEADEKDE